MRKALGDTPNPAALGINYVSPSGCQVRVYLNDEECPDVQGVVFDFNNQSTYMAFPVQGKFVLVLHDAKYVSKFHPGGELYKAFDLTLQANTEYGNGYTVKLGGLSVAGMKMQTSVDDISTEVVVAFRGQMHPVYYSSEEQLEAREKAFPGKQEKSSDGN
jgi:hypothetical protein